MGAKILLKTAVILSLLILLTSCEQVTKPKELLNVGTTGCYTIQSVDDKLASGVVFIHLKNRQAQAPSVKISTLLKKCPLTIGLLF